MELFPGLELGQGVGAGRFGAQALAVGFAMEEAAAQVQTQPGGDRFGLFGRHLADQEGADFLQGGRGGSFLLQAQGVIGREVPRLTVRAPTVVAEEGQGAVAGFEGAGQVFPVHQGALAGGALAGRGVGLALRGALGQQAQRCLGGASQLFLDGAQVRFGMVLDAVQTGLPVLLPGLEFGGGERGLGEGGGGLAGGAGGQDFIGQVAALGLSGATGFAGCGGQGGHGWGIREWGGRGVPCQRSRNRGCKG